MGERRHDRQLAEARTAYTAAVLRLLKAMNAFDRSAFPLDPGSALEPVPWTRRHVAIAQALEAGWRDVLRTRKRSPPGSSRSVGWTRYSSSPGAVEEALSKLQPDLIG